MNALNLFPELKLVTNNGKKHQDLLVDMFKFIFIRNNSDGSSYYKCRGKGFDLRPCCASITLKDGSLGGGILKRNLAQSTGCKGFVLKFCFSFCYFGLIRLFYDYF